ncbi:tetratricopeptide repeat protein [Tichowtungia aerotolerans]|uniref:Tetratricopeptide repeat protein n=1 Tax=Tichowtungia aerotolerans TaxID=2697043 RepID=A0A6P1MA15_9BACT|nr:tetratricopeptide repeat protein [Tichowtungia aerotolerans]QHI69923.1 tetratricopeptide repeat protein [Tichowtungia aerotolerans]
MMKYISAAIIALLLCGCASMAQKGALVRAYKNYEKRDYEDVISLVAMSESYKTPTPELKSELAYLKAIALEKLGRKDEAQGIFLYLTEQFPDSEYAYRAKEKLKSPASTSDQHR